MKRKIFLLLIIYSTFLCVLLNANNLHEVKIIGIEKIKDSDFKRDLLKYLTLREQLDYENLYYFLSKSHLKKYFKNIKNANEYSRYMKNNSEVSEIKYLEICTINYEESKYKVELIFESFSEGINARIKTSYFFIKEDGRWKYDTFDKKNYKVVK